MRRMLALLTLVLPLTFGVAACGNDDDAVDTAESTAVTETTAEESEVVVSEPATTEAEETVPETVADDSDATDDTVASDTTVLLADTTAPAGSGDDPRAVADRLTNTIKDSFGESISSDQADCMSQSMIDRLGAEKLLEYDRTDIDFETLPDEEQAAIFETFTDCGDVLPQLLAAEIQKDGTLNREQAECVATGLLDAIGVQGLLQLAKDSSNIPADAQPKLIAALTTCLPPEVLATIPLS